MDGGQPLLELLGRQPITPADHLHRWIAHAVIACFRDRRHHVLQQRLTAPGGARLLRAIQHGDRLHSRRQRAYERLHIKRPKEPHFHQPNALAGLDLEREVAQHLGALVSRRVAPDLETFLSGFEHAVEVISTRFGPTLSALERVRQAAERDRKQRFTALLHHVYDMEQLRTAYHALKRDAAAGIDGEMWGHDGEGLEEHLQDLAGRLRRGAYRAKPVRRAYIPKADGRPRPLGVPTLEDKLVQRAVVAVLNAIYEVDFLRFSYGFRPGRSPHQALDALAVGITTKKVNWVLDADIRGFFDTLDHGWLVKFVEHRIADRR